MIVLVTLLAWATGLAQKKRPVAQTIAEGIVWRESEDDRPPWKRITITNIFGFKTRPAVGDEVTVVTVDAPIPTFSLRILKATPKQESCDERSPLSWEVELQPITQKTFFEASPPPERRPEFPFDVVIIYPAVKLARQIGNNQLKPEMLPRGVLIDTVEAAIDLNEDHRPDMVVVKYCCSTGKQMTENCNYECGKTFKKAGNAWRLVNSSAPC